MGYILSELPSAELKNYPLYEDDDGKTLRPHAVEALKWIYSAIEEYRTSNSRYEEKLTALALQYALTLPDEKKTKLLKEEYSKYGKNMDASFKGIFLKNLPDSQDLYVEEMKDKVLQFFKKNSDYDDWGANLDKELEDILFEIKISDFKKFISAVRSDSEITPEAWLNFIEALNSNNYLENKNDLLKVIIPMLDEKETRSSKYEGVKNKFSPEMQKLFPSL